jgi:cytochrome P450
MTVEFDFHHPPTPDIAIPLYDEVRPAGCPVHAGDDTFLATTHADVLTILRNPARFPQTSRPVTDDEKVLSELNGDLHASVRSVFMQLITPRRMQEYEPLVRTCFREAIERLAGAERCEVVNEIGRPVTATIIGLLAELDDDLLQRVPTYAENFARVFNGDVAYLAPIRDLDARITAVVGERRRAAGERHDWLSVLLQCVDEQGRPLSDERITTMFTKNLLVGGSETSSRVIGFLFHYVLTTPGVLDALRADPSLIASAVEEGLRLAPALRAIQRAVPDEIELSGATLPAGCRVLAGLEAANRDPAAFEEPAAFRLDRGARGRRHVTFGHGPHLCIGAPLARLELSVCLEEFVQRFPHPSVPDDFTVEYALVASLNGMKEMPVLLGPH